MNIFLISPKPRECAQALDDLRLNKMILETAQMLCTAFRHYYPDRAEAAKETLYKETHVNHPCNVWLREDRENYIWLLSYFNELYKEKLYRTDKPHLSYTKLWPILSAPISAGCISTPLYDYVDFNFNCSNVEPTGSILIDYQQCLIAKWKADKRKPQWTKRGIPPFLANYVKLVENYVAVHTESVDQYA